jgi:hypothetical protein
MFGLFFAYQLIPRHLALDELCMQGFGDGKLRKQKDRAY